MKNKQNQTYIVFYTGNGDVQYFGKLRKERDVIEKHLGGWISPCTVLCKGGHLQKWNGEAW